MGPGSVLPQGSAMQGGRMWEVDFVYPKLSLGGNWAIGQPLDTASGVGKHCLRLGTARAAIRPGPSGSQALDTQAPQGAMEGVSSLSSTGNKATFLSRSHRKVVGSFF